MPHFPSLPIAPFVHVITRNHFLSSTTKRGTKGTKGSTSTNTNANNISSSKLRPFDDKCHQGSTRSCHDAPPAIIFRAPKVQAQKRLHGKPAASFFVRAHATATSAALLPSKTTVAPAAVVPDEAARCCSASMTPSLATTTAAPAGVSPPNTAEHQQQVASSSPASRATAAEQKSASAAVDVVVNSQPHLPPPTSGTMSLASAASAASAAAVGNGINPIATGTCASAHDGSCTSTVSDGHDTTAGNTSFLEAATLDSSIVSRNTHIEGRVVPPSGGKSRVLKSSATSRCTFSRAAGSKGGGSRPVVRGSDGWSMSRVPEGVCSLDGELMLLDGILHDRKVRTWVETTLVPAKTHHHRHVTSSEKVSSRDTDEKSL